MESHEATIARSEKQTELIFKIGPREFKICLTDDNPGEVKKVFNALIVELKKGKFQFALSDSEKDLYHYICDEYVKQLNGEIANVYSQLKQCGLLGVESKKV